MQAVLCVPLSSKYVVFAFCHLNTGMLRCDIRAGQSYHEFSLSCKAVSHHVLIFDECNV